mmetsp:Transcript_8537/g.13853  ORF Transcript_8537/g.13853 Transcript_8537/m.13853 type:complete len:108 (-) Transcript_8537:74-397(-)
MNNDLIDELAAIGSSEPVPVEPHDMGRLASLYLVAFHFRAKGRNPICVINSLSPITRSCRSLNRPFQFYQRNPERVPDLTFRSALSELPSVSVGVQRNRPSYCSVDS